jgi:hypothetical protein
MDLPKMSLETIKNKPVVDLNLSVRVQNCFENVKIQTIEQLLQHKAVDLLKIKNFGRRSLREVTEALNTKGLRLGMLKASSQASKREPKEKRIILGIGYPRFYTTLNSDGMFCPCYKVGLAHLDDNISLKYTNAKGVRTENCQYRLVLEKVKAKNKMNP